MGRAEAGKTTVCTQFIANGYSTRYEHTESPHMYYREMKPKDLSMNNESKYTSSFVGPFSCSAIQLKRFLNLKNERR